MSDRLVLRRLALSDRAEVTAAAAELVAEGRRWSYQYRDDVPWGDYVALVHGWEDGIDLPEDSAPQAELVGDVEGRIIGRLSVRFELNEFHRTWGGHIGYMVRPTCRGRGHATAMLGQSIDVLRDRGVDRILVTCNDDNLASARVIETNGGVLESVIPNADPQDVPKRRYWIE